MSGVKVGIYPVRSGYGQSALKSNVLQLKNCIMELVRIVYYEARFGLYDIFGLKLNWHDI